MVDAGVTDAYVTWRADHRIHRFSDPTELIPSMEEAMDVTGAPMRAGSRPQVVHPTPPRQRAIAPTQRASGHARPLHPSTSTTGTSSRT